MFVRIKEIKGKPYLYLVENKWTKGKVKQVVKKYIGRVFDFKKEKNNKNFFEFYSISNVNSYVRGKNKEDIVKDLVAHELFNHGFIAKGKNKWIFEKIVVDLSNLSVNIKKRETALKLNEGHLYSDGLKKIVAFKPGRDKEKSGLELAEMFANAGITVPQEVFIGLIMGKGFTQVIE
ncbi:MAG: hypothetical protein U9R08_00155 [Nanoarchaeota archaeon]|nr:hypothetical protein [Nanoarchaeota archaeon]